MESTFSASTVSDPASAQTTGQTVADRFAILGYGRFGRAFADLLVQAGQRVRAYDPVAHIPPQHAAASPAEAIEGAHWVVLAMPVRQMRAALQALRPQLLAGQTVMDVGSVKMGPWALMEQYLGAAIPHVGAHPLFGPLSLARGERPLRAVICPSPRHPQAAARARELFVKLGCQVTEVNPASHDRAMANTHALAFFIAKGLVEMGVDGDSAMAPPSFQGMQNMLAAVRGDAGHLFAAIQQENPFAAEARTQLLTALLNIHRMLVTHADEEGALDIPALPDIAS